MKLSALLIILLTAFLLSGCAGQLSTSNQSPTQTPSGTITPLPMATIPPPPTATPIPPSAQKVPGCEISNIKMVPFDSLTGTFQEEIKQNDEHDFSVSLDPSFSLSLFVVVEISCHAYLDGIYLHQNRGKVEITVMEDKWQKAKKIEEMILLLPWGDGKIFVPIWLDRLRCIDVKINARIIEQKKTVSTMKRTVKVICEFCL